MIAVKNNEVYISVSSVEKLSPTIKAISRAICWEAKRLKYNFSAEEIEGTFLLTDLLEQMIKKQEQLLK